jgi:uncharacterized protein YeaO (DUF488 family)
MTQAENFRKWYLANKEKYHEYQRAYRKRNRARVTEIERKSVKKRELREMREARGIKCLTVIYAITRAIH